MKKVPVTVKPVSTALGILGFLTFFAVAASYLFDGFVMVFGKKHGPALFWLFVLGLVLWFLGWVIYAAFTGQIQV